jgi:GDSL-like Lipase/Acylhydrolase
LGKFLFVHKISFYFLNLQTLYDNGARKFWVHNTGPLGCLPQKLALPRKDNTDLDVYGCLSTFNNGAREFNRQLSTLVDALSTELNDATIVYTDIFSIKYDIIANYTKYGTFLIILLMKLEQYY